MSKLIPDYVFDSIYDITPALLERHGIRGVLIDLDGTMASHKARCRLIHLRLLCARCARQACRCWCFPTTASDA